MKKKKSRLIVSLLTAFIMAFTVIPYMGAANQVSAEEDPYIQKYTSSQSTPITQVKFIPDGEGTFGIELTIDYEVYDNEHWQMIEAVSLEVIDADSDQCYVNMSTSASGGRGTFTWGTSRAKIVPGSVIFILFTFGEDYYGDYPLNNVDWQGFYTSVPQLKPADCIHSWNTGTVTKAATCKEAGVKTYTCTKCSTTKTGTIDKLTTHSYSGGACTVCGVADPSVKVEAAKDKALGSVTVPKGDYTKKEYPIGQLYLDKSVDTLTFYGVPGTLVIRDSSGNKVVSGKEFFYNEDIDQYFAKAGMYKVYAETSSTSGIQDYTYDVTYTLTKDIIYSYKYPSLTATATERGMDNVPAVKIEYGDFDGPSGSVTDQLAIFREANGKIRKLDTSYYTGLVDTIKIDYGTQYTYYIVDLSYVSGTAKTTLSNVGTVDEPLTDAIKTALTDSHVTKSNTVTTKSMTVSGVQGLKVYKKGVRTVSLDWGCTSGADQYLTGYIMQSYNSAGKLMQTKTVKRQGFISGESIYIPYAGTSKVTVTPYEDFTDGKRYYGSAQTISVTSAKITAPGGHVTKISSKSARVVATKATGATGLQVQQKVGKKWKTVTSGSKASTYKKTWTKNSAGKTSYRYRSYIKDQGKTYYSSWKTYKPKSNVGTYTKWSVSYMRNLHGAMDVYFIPTKIQYKGSKIKVTGRFINTWRYAPDKGKFKVTFKVDGKSIGYKTIKSKSIKANSYKTTTFYLSGAKKGKDLRSAGYSVKTYY